MNRLTYALLGAAFVMGATPCARAVPGVRSMASPEAWLIQSQSGSAVEQQDAAESAQDRADAVRDAAEHVREQAEHAREAAERAQDAREAARDKYEAGLDAIDEARWSQAREDFDELVRRDGPQSDAALYWRAYCEDKLGRRADALASVADLEHKYPQSRWQNDAKVLELQVRHENGQPVSPQSQDDEELKLLAINALMQNDPAKALPFLQKTLNGTGSPKLKERALFVLAQSGTPGATQILTGIASGNSNPELQRKAIRYIGLYEGSQGVESLSRIYASSTDEEVKRTILQSYMVAGAQDRLYAAAQNEKNPDLQRQAVQMLGVSGARDDLSKLYQSNPPEETRRAILQAMFVAGDSQHLEELAKNEKNEDLRLAAIRDMGLMGSDRTASTLTSMYAGAKDPATSKAVLQALFLQGNAQAIIDIARKESDPELKREAVQKLSLMHSKAATDYLLEILNK